MANAFGLIIVTVWVACATPVWAQDDIDTTDSPKNAPLTDGDNQARQTDTQITKDLKPAHLTSSVPPTDPAVQTNDDLAVLQSEFQAMKRQFLDLSFGIRDLEAHNGELMARVQKVAPIGISPELRDVTSRIEVLETALTDDRLDDIVARLSALEANNSGDAAGSTDLTTRIYALENRIKSIELTLSNLTPEPTEPTPLSGDPNPEATSLVGDARFLAEMNDSGGIVSVLKRNLSPTDYALPASGQCSDAGAWFDETHALTDYRAFFTWDGDTVRVCKQTVSGWRDLVASNNERAHIITEVR